MVPQTPKSKHAKSLIKMPGFTFKLDAPEDFTPSLDYLNTQDT